MHRFLLLAGTGRHSLIALHPGGAQFYGKQYGIRDKTLIVTHHYCPITIVQLWICRLEILLMFHYYLTNNLYSLFIPRTVMPTVQLAMISNPIGCNYGYFNGYFSPGSRPRSMITGLAVWFTWSCVVTLSICSPGQKSVPCKDTR